MSASSSCESWQLSANVRKVPRQWKKAV